MMNRHKEISVGIVGSSGYTGGELIRILLRHPSAHITYLASRTHAGAKVCDVSDAVSPECELRFLPLDVAAITAACDVVFTAVPHGASMEFGPPIIEAGKTLIDIGTDFRFRDASTYEAWYGVTHACPELSADAAYGLPELFRDGIATKRIIGNPGCYPTSILLGIAPLWSRGFIDPTCINITAMSGASGAGASPKALFHLPEATENVQAYGIGEHRHTPEIEQGLSLLDEGPSTGSDAKPRVSFTPHLVPMSRGILSTLVLSPVAETNAEDLQAVFEQRYADEPFVRVLPQDALPRTKPLRGTNMCHLAVRYDARARRIVVISTIDNLGKGAAGQAVQNMNLICGLPETEGLDVAGIYP